MFWKLKFSFRKIGKEIWWNIIVLEKICHCLIFDHKRFGYGFLNPGDFFTIRPGNNWGFPAPNAAWIIGEFKIPRVAAFDLSFTMLVLNFFSRPILLITCCTFAVEHHDFNFHTRSFVAEFIVNENWNCSSANCCRWSRGSGGWRIQC